MIDGLWREVNEARAIESSVSQSARDIEIGERRSEGRSAKKASQLTS